MNRPIRISAALVAVVALAACGRPSSAVSEDLQHDLDLASRPGVELAPSAGRVEVVSALEQGKSAAPEKSAEPRVAPKRLASAPKGAVRAPIRRATVATVSAPAPEAAEAQVRVAQTPAPAPTPSPVEEPAPIVTPTPSPSPAPARGSQRGGTWTMADVIRNAPFPIKP
jgi:outer membrane biosynthesis protein TonB